MTESPLDALAQSLADTADEMQQLETALSDIVSLLDAGALTGQTAARMRAALCDRVLPLTGQLHTHFDRLARDLQKRA